MVNFWATWCPVCKAEMPNWQRFYDANKGRGFELIAMSIDDDQSALAKHAKEKKFGFPIAWRWDDKTDDSFGDIIGTPTLFIVDKNGKVAWTKRGRVTPGAARSDRRAVAELADCRQRRFARPRRLAQTRGNWRGARGQGRKEEIFAERRIFYTHSRSGPTPNLLIRGQIRQA